METGKILVLLYHKSFSTKVLLHPGAFVQLLFYKFSKETRMAFAIEETITKVKAVIAEKLSIPLENVTTEATLKDLGADSLDIVEMIMTFEEIFGIEVKDEDAEKISTVQDAIDYMHPLRTK